MNRQRSQKLVKKSKDKELFHAQIDPKRQRLHKNLNKIPSTTKINDKMMQDKSSKQKDIRNKSKKNSSKQVLKVDIQDGKRKRQDLNMKSELKKLISKNSKKIENKVAANDNAPNVLKNIQKYCKLLKNIHQQQQEDYQRKDQPKGNQAAKTFKKSSLQYNPSISAHQNPQKQHLSKSKFNQPTKNNRFSLEMAKSHAVNEQKQYMINSIYKDGGKEEREGVERRGSHKQNRQLIDIWQEYKKSVEVEEIKLQKSAKVTNYNSSQSRNSSSLFVSHGFSNIIESLNKDNQEQFIKSKENISNLINNQKQSLEKPIQDKRKHLKMQKVHEIIYLPMLKQPLEKHQPKNMPGMNEIESKFMRSKYFVRQIPGGLIRGKKRQQKDGPLAGCEITVIENDIWNEQSDFDELQL